MLTSYDSLPLRDLLAADLTMMPLALTELDLILLLLAHAVPFLADVAYDISHSPCRIELLKITLPTLDVPDEGRNLFAFGDDVFIASETFRLS